MLRPEVPWPLPLVRCDRQTAQKNSDVGDVLGGDDVLIGKRQHFGVVAPSSLYVGDLLDDDRGMLSRQPGVTTVRSAASADAVATLADDEGLRAASDISLKAQDLDPFRIHLVPTLRFDIAPRHGHVCASP